MALGQFVGSVSSWLCGMAVQVRGSRAGADVSVLLSQSAPAAGAGAELRMVLHWGRHDSGAEDTLSSVGYASAGAELVPLPSPV